MLSGRDRFFSLETREEKVLEFINLYQGSMSIKEYVLKFIPLSKYDPTTVVDPRASMSKFILGVFEWLTKNVIPLCSSMILKFLG